MTLQELESHLWGAANILRGKIARYAQIAVEEETIDVKAEKKIMEYLKEHAGAFRETPLQRPVHN